MQSEIEIEVKIKTDELNMAIEKAKQLTELLQEAKRILASFTPTSADEIMAKINEQSAKPNRNPIRV